MASTAELMSRQLLSSPGRSRSLASGQESFNPARTGTETWVTATDTEIAKTLGDWMVAILLGPVTPDADGTTITPDQSGATFTNTGAVAIAPFVLPAAAAGLNYEFIVTDADGLRVTAASGDTIRVTISVSAAAGNIASTQIGATLKLRAVDTTQWIATSINGDWTLT